MNTNTGQGFDQWTSIINIDVTSADYSNDGNIFYIYPNLDWTVYIDSKHWDTNQPIFVIAWIVPPITITKIYSTGTTIPTWIKVIV